MCLGIVSQIRLYGVRSDSTAATGVDVLQNYKMDKQSLTHVNKDRDEKLIAFDFNTHVYLLHAVYCQTLLASQLDFVT